MEYTKGEWKVEWDFLGGYDCMSHAYRIYSGHRHGGQLITAVDIGDYKANQDGRTEEETNCLEAKANAYLIASAPEMYEALKGLAIVYNVDRESIILNQDPVYWERAVKALAKAEGK